MLHVLVEIWAAYCEVQEALEVVEKNSLLKTAKENAGTIGGGGFLVIGACIGICVWRYCKAAAGK